MSPDTATLGRRARALLDALAEITDVPGEITRLYLSPAHKRAVETVSGWMRDAGLDVTVDALGTVHGRMSGSGGSNRRLLIGSHIDTVINAGRFDGCFGVVAGILVAEEMARRGRRPPFGLEILAFGDEEGVRFPTALSSSAALAGGFEPRWLTMADAQGVTLQQALAEFGLDPAQIDAAAIAADEVIGYLETHIEQGPALAHHGAALGIVTAIAGQSRFRMTFEGLAGHAGTVPMALRRDAFSALAELAVGIERIARDGTDGLVATIGRVEVKPGAVNVIPDHVITTLDVRAGTDASRRGAIAAIRAEAGRIAAARNVAITITQFHEVATTPMDGDLQGALAAATAPLGLTAPHLASGAGHDAMAMARRFPSAMLFVRSGANGISHHPTEHSTDEDLGLAVAALIGAVDTLAQSGAA